VPPLPRAAAPDDPGRPGPPVEAPCLRAGPSGGRPRAPSTSAIAANSSPAAIPAPAGAASPAFPVAAGAITGVTRSVACVPPNCACGAIASLVAVPLSRFAAPRAGSGWPPAKPLLTPLFASVPASHAARLSVIVRGAVPVKSGSESTPTKPSFDPTSICTSEKSAPGVAVNSAVAVAPAGALAAFAISLWAARSAARRLDAVREAVDRLAEGAYEAPGPLEGDRAEDEVGRGAAQVERLRERLVDARRQQGGIERQRRELTAAISHDLRTPLASIRALAEALDDGVADDDETRRRDLRAMRRESERLSRMVDDLVDLSRLDAGALRLDVRSLPLEEIASEVAALLAPLAEQSGVAIEVAHGSPPTVVMVDGARIERVLMNLLRNAIDHSPRGERVEVRMGVAGGRAWVAVHNAGPPIPARELPLVWERFYRSEQSRARSRAADADGAGLGLAIVKGLVELHGGAASARSSDGEGTTFRVELPAGV